VVTHSTPSLWSVAQGKLFSRAASVLGSMYGTAGGRALPHRIIAFRAPLSFLWRRSFAKRMIFAWGSAVRSRIPQRLKPNVDRTYFAARLKPCPDTNLKMCNVVRATAGPSTPRLDSRSESNRCARDDNLKGLGPARFLWFGHATCLDVT
jgi:hypothetical protein